MRWTLQEIAQALGVAVPSGLAPLAWVAGVSIDSRAVGRGQLFVAIRGPRHDGHDFVAAALQAGAEAAVVASERVSSYPAPIRGRLFAVGDTLAALQDLARAVRRAWGRRIAAVTGSVGKTTTKEILAALLGAKFRMLKSEGNLNNEYGLPLTLLRLDPEDEAAVVELGMSHRGELRRLAEIAEPEVGVVTRVAPVHLEFFASIDEIALAKRELIEGLAGPDPVAVLNADDPRVARFAEVARGRVLTFGCTAAAQFRADKIHDYGAGGSDFEFVGPGGRARLALALPGRHSIENALAALAAASVWGIGVAEAADVLRNIKVGEMRGKLLQFAAGFALINDSYNSNPVALAAMIDLLAQTGVAHTEAAHTGTAKTGNYRRRILAAGEMLELGPESANLHRQAGRYAASQRIDCIVAVQGDAAQISNGAIAAGMSPSQAHFFADSSAAAAFVAELVQPGDLLLVKGSRGVKMERIVESLRAKYPLADEMPAPAVPRGRD
jgi:UDP-N-acetylmuramoyl-tripeptide--D-alanyl-D-alanine ligase